MRGVVEILPVLVVAIVLIAGATQLRPGNDVYRQIGRGGLSVDDAAPAPAPSPAEREEEIRQMLGARNARRARQGRAALDVEAEVARLTRGVSRGASAGPGVPADPALEQEVRELVIARNARRARRGQPPLDVEAEVRRQLQEL